MGCGQGEVGKAVKIGGGSVNEFLERHSSGAKAHLDSMRLIPGINPLPTARKSFFAIGGRA
jgi:hypothetical protein